MYNRRFKDSNDRNVRYDGRIQFGSRDENFASDSGIPSRGEVSNDSSTMQAIAFRDLKSGVFDVAADPNTQATSNADPYAIIARTNPVVGGTYGGEATILGNVITRLANASKSGFLNYFDSGVTFKKFHYQYLAIDADDKNKAFNAEMAKTTATALSNGMATLTLQLPFFKDFVKSDMPYKEGVDGSVYSSALEARLPWMVYYQSAVLNLAAIPAKYLQIRSLEKAVKDMTYRRDNTEVNELYGLLKKAAFVSMINSLATTVIGEYTDNDWRIQVNTLVNVPSRKTNAYTSPLLTMVGYHKMPTLKLIANTGQDTPTSDTGVYFDSSSISATLVASTSRPLYDPFNMALITSNLTLNFEQAIKMALTLLDQTTVLGWARKNTMAASDADRIPSQWYYNTLDLVLSKIVSMSSQIFNGLSEIRSGLDKLKDTGLVYWQKGISFFIGGKVDQYSLTYNKTLADVFASDKTGSANIVFDDLTYRWKFNTLWNMYEGIPLYDKVSGGAFLTFATKGISVSDAAPNYYSAKFIYPNFFENDTVGVTSQASANDRFVNRVGNVIYVASEEVKGEELIKSTTLARFNPFDATSEEGFVVKFADVDLDLSDDNNKIIASYVQAVLQSVYGVGIVSNTADSTKIGAIQMDDLCFIDVEISDIANSMIQYARDKAPFRVSRISGVRSMGFGNR